MYVRRALDKQRVAAGDAPVIQEDEQVPIASRDYWFNVVEMLQTNWALIDTHSSGGVIVWFFGDTSRVFDEMKFESDDQARWALTRNGFRLFAKVAEAHKFLLPPEPPFVRGRHPNGPIYSSGRFWI